MLDYRPEDLSPDAIAKIAAYRAECLAYAERPRAGQPLRDGEMLCSAGVCCMYSGLAALARRHFELALPRLLAGLGPNGIPESETRFAPGSELTSNTAGHGGGARPIQISGASIVLGFDARDRSDWWIALAVCRWFLEGRHDAEAFQNASNELVRFIQNHADWRRDPDWLDSFGRTFCAARGYRRVIEYAVRPGATLGSATRPPKPLSERGMAVCLARHHLEGLWDARRLDAAWQAFLSARVQKLNPVALTLWMKMRYWDSVDPKPDPYETFMRAYDHVPHLPKPPVQH